MFLEVWWRVLMMLVVMVWARVEVKVAMSSEEVVEAAVWVEG